MKKKILMSEESLKLMFTDEPETVAEETEVEATEIEATEETEVETEVEATEEVVEDVTAESVELAELKVELEVANASIETITAEAATASAALEEAEAGLVSMKEIVSEQISRMRIALKLSAVEMEEWDAGALAKEYNAVKKTFVKSLPVGSVIPKNTETEEVKGPVLTSLDASAHKSLGF